MQHPIDAFGVEAVDPGGADQDHGHAPRAQSMKLLERSLVSFHVELLKADALAYQVLLGLTASTLILALLPRVLRL